MGQVQPRPLGRKRLSASLIAKPLIFRSVVPALAGVGRRALVGLGEPDPDDPLAFRPGRRRAIGSATPGWPEMSLAEEGSATVAIAARRDGDSAPYSPRGAGLAPRRSRCLSRNRSRATPSDVNGPVSHVLDAELRRPLEEFRPGA
jgi:hypothetical protein